MVGEADASFAQLLQVRGEAEPERARRDPLRVAQLVDDDHEDVGASRGRRSGWSARSARLVAWVRAAPCRRSRCWRRPSPGSRRRPRRPRRRRSARVAETSGGRRACPVSRRCSPLARGSALPGPVGRARSELSGRVGRICIMYPMGPGTGAIRRLWASREGPQAGGEMRPCGSARCACHDHGRGVRTARPRRNPPGPASPGATNSWTTMMDRYATGLGAAAGAELQRRDARTGRGRRLLHL